MRKKITAKKNRTASIVRKKQRKHSVKLMKLTDVVPKIVNHSPWSVKKITILDNYSFKVKFLDGVEGVVKMKSLIMNKSAGVFKALRDPSVFQKAFIQLGAVTWPGEIDLAPDAMHDAIQKKGKWILR